MNDNPYATISIEEVWLPSGDAGGWRFLFPRAERRPRFRKVTMGAFLALTQFYWRPEWADVREVMAQRPFTYV